MNFNGVNLMKAICILSGLILTVSSCSILAAQNNNEFSDEMKSYLLSENLPIPNSGIKVVSQHQINYLSKPDIEKRAKAKLEIKKYGYYFDTENTRAEELLNFKNSISDGEYKKNPNEIKLSFNFKEIKSNMITNILGYVPEGSYVKNLGWSGIGVDFNTTFGGCAYTVSNMNVTGMSATFGKEDVTYSINKKITLFSSSGSDKTKYLYHLMWFDNNFYRELECASEKYSDKIKAEVITLAINLDVI